MESHLVQCYNRGCGLKFDPLKNEEDVCCHHPGVPVFHDAYKGWSCCNKKCIDFTEFLNIKGCTSSKHSSVKPIEEKKKQEISDKEIVEVKPLVHVELKRPPIDTPLVTVKPEIASSLRQQLLTNQLQNTTINPEFDGDSISVGTSCKNNGCTASYQGVQSNEETCVYHSGTPIFHEGLKYWSCCQKKTVDFDVFLSQAGCQTGKHLWKKEENDEKTVNCRWDWHQTGSHVVVSIYAKNYCVNSTIVQLNPIRLFANLVFPQQSDATFTLDIELERMIDLKASQVSMFGTKIEIKLRKAEPYSWTKLERAKTSCERESKPQDARIEPEPEHEPVDLSDF